MLTLAPRWNFIAMPNLIGRDALSLDDVSVLDESLAVVAPSAEIDLIGEFAYQWNGDNDYVPVRNLVAGQAYWIYNAAIEPEQTLTLTWGLPNGFDQQPLLAAASSAISAPHVPLSGHQTRAPAGSPPAPAGSTGARSNASASGGGCGIGVGLLLPMLLAGGFISLRRRRRRSMPQLCLRQ